MKIKIIFFIVTLVLLAVLVPAGVYFLRDLVEVYNLNFSNFTSSYFINLFFSKETYFRFFKDIDTPNILGWGIFAYFFINSILGMFGNLKVYERYSQTDTYGSHGTSRWQTKKEIIKNYSKDKMGWFLGTWLNDKVYNLGMEGAYHPLNGELNMQMTVIGPPGSQKTTGFVLPNIFHIPYIYKNSKEKADLIITDPKSEIWALTSDYLEKEGYEVRVLDFIHLKYGDTINPLDSIETEKELMEIADGYVRSVEASTGEGSKDGFWAEQEGQALGALIGAIKQVRPKEKQVIYECLRTLTDEMTNHEGAIDMIKAKAFFTENNIEGAALQLWKNFLLICKSENTAGNILGGLAGKLKLFAIEEIQNITSRTTIDIKKLGAKKERPMALYIFMPDGDRTFTPIINVVISSIFVQLYKTAYLYNNKLYNPVYFILEEMANIGRISGIQEKLGTMRGRRIYPMMIWQSLSQMKNRYKDGWEDILSMCDTQVYLGINDDFTAKYCSDKLGNTTIKVQSLSRKPDSLVNDNQSESQNYQQRKLMYPDECSRLENGKMILIQRSKYPAILEKTQYKYWEEKLKICIEKNVKDLPQISKSFKNNELSLDVEDFTVDEHKKERIFEKRNFDKDEKEINIDFEEFQEKENLNFDEIELDIEELKKEFEIDRGF